MQLPQLWILRLAQATWLPKLLSHSLHDHHVTNHSLDTLEFAACHPAWSPGRCVKEAARESCVHCASNWIPSLDGKRFHSILLVDTIKQKTEESKNVHKPERRSFWKVPPNEPQFCVEVPVVISSEKSPGKICWTKYPLIMVKRSYLRGFVKLRKDR